MSFSPITSAVTQLQVACEDQPRPQCTSAFCGAKTDDIPDAALRAAAESRSKK